MAYALEHCSSGSCIGVHSLQQSPLYARPCCPDAHDCNDSNIVTTITNSSIRVAVSVALLTSFQLRLESRIYHLHEVVNSSSDTVSISARSVHIIATNGISFYNFAEAQL
jgi:hypothetical protein